MDRRARVRLLAMVYLNKAQLYKSQRQCTDAREMCDQAWRRVSRQPGSNRTSESYFRFPFG